MVWGGLRQQPDMGVLLKGIGQCTCRLRRWYASNKLDLKKGIREKQDELKVAISNIVGGSWRGCHRGWLTIFIVLALVFGRAPVRKDVGFTSANGGRYVLLLVLALRVLVARNLGGSLYGKLIFPINMSVCNSKVESTMHTFLGCPSLKPLRAGLWFMKGVCNSWRLLDVSLFKVNFDAAIDAVWGRVRIGLIICDSGGLVMALCDQKIAIVYSPHVAEAIAILRGIQFAMDSGLVPFSLESDAQVIVNLVNNGVFPCSEVGLIIKDISLKLESFSNVSIDFVPRMANMTAHCLAKIGSIDTYNYWMEDCPPCVALVVFGDCPKPM
ncbi:hypothetical protein Dsin_028311 [Dipteronia sinensis]|uniref:RNase H type-1 domain-containing protein n=1 Tax=Dipteronia sinensis TaxID=43782 RepID=A0AAD9ZR30_9ROSI|nr:hypothetical protein Dsin_028311 [Dipteronia sinensis]